MEKKFTYDIENDGLADVMTIYMYGQPKAEIIMYDTPFDKEFEEDMRINLIDSETCDIVDTIII